MSNARDSAYINAFLSRKGAPAVPVVARKKRGEGEHAKRKAAIVARTPAVMLLLSAEVLPEGVRVKSKRDRPNGFEIAYGKQLEMQFRCGEVIAYDFQPIHLDLGGGVSYCPDYVVRMSDGSIEIVEIKGQRRDGGLVRFKLAVDRFPQFRFRLVGKRRGEWCELRVYGKAKVNRVH